MYTPLGATVKDLLQSVTGATGGTGSGQDITKPQISNVQATPSTTSAVITWTTNELASSQVEYGRTKDQTLLSELRDDPTALDAEGNPISAGAITHSITLTGLTPSIPAGNIMYYYKVKSKDAAGNEAVYPASDSDWKTFETKISDT